MLDSPPKANERVSAPPLIAPTQITCLRERWCDLTDRYLPLIGETALWRYNREWSPDYSKQGWKIHLSATILSACEVLETAAPLLQRTGVLYKSASTLDELAKLNSGLWYGYTQVGKVITVYPFDDDQFRCVINQLYRILPAGVSAPAVPFNYRYSPGSNIYFRYGGFVTRKVNDDSDTPVAGLVSPSGELVPDRRDLPAPSWVEVPIPLTFLGAPATSSPLSERYRVFRSISQRGKGGVYEAIDTGVCPPRFCIIKEGRLHGETAWDGRDGRDRVKHEVIVLEALHLRGVPVPRLFDSFETDGNAYAVLEKVSGEGLHQYVARQRRRLSIRKATAFGKQISALVAAIHAAGWAWRDCKPANLLVCEKAKLRPIDLEGACRLDRPDPLPWTTPNFAAPEIFEPALSEIKQTNGPEDLFALGMCLFFLFEGKLPERQIEYRADEDKPPANPSREKRDKCLVGKCVCTGQDGSGRSRFFSRRVPDEIVNLIRGLLCQNYNLRPAATTAFEILEATERQLIKQIGKPKVVADRVE